MDGSICKMSSGPSDFGECFVRRRLDSAMFRGRVLILIPDFQSMIAMRFWIDSVLPLSSVAFLLFCLS